MEFQCVNISYFHMKRILYIAQRYLNVNEECERGTRGMHLLERKKFRSLQPDKI